MRYEDQLKAWKESENVLSSADAWEILISGHMEGFVKGWLDVETDLKMMMWSAKTYVKAKNTFKK